jgi:hypothetical protein
LQAVVGKYAVLFHLVILLYASPALLVDLNALIKELQRSLWMRVELFESGLHDWSLFLKVSSETNRVEVLQPEIVDALIPRRRGLMMSKKQVLLMEMLKVRL